jgi:hypothetical protein
LNDKLWVVEQRTLAFDVLQLLVVAYDADTRIVYKGSEVLLWLLTNFAFLGVIDAGKTLRRALQALKRMAIIIEVILTRTHTVE